MLPTPFIFQFIGDGLLQSQLRRSILFHLIGDKDGNLCISKSSYRSINILLELLLIVILIEVGILRTRDSLIGSLHCILIVALLNNLTLNHLGLGNGIEDLILTRTKLLHMLDLLFRVLGHIGSFQSPLDLIGHISRSQRSVDIKKDIGIILLHFCKSIINTILDGFIQIRIFHGDGNGVVLCQIQIFLIVDIRRFGEVIHHIS